MKSPTPSSVSLLSTAYALAAVCGLTMVCGLNGCSKDSKDTVPAAAVQSFCKEIQLSQIDFSGYLGAARNELRLAGESAKDREELCKTMKSSLDALQAYSLGYNRGLYQSRALGMELHRVYSETLLPNIVDIGVTCRTNRTEHSKALLAKFEREIADDFAKQLAICKTMGFKAASEQTP